MSRYKSYSKYKDSGVEWIGWVPDTWSVAAIKRISTIANGATPDSKMASFWDGDVTWFTPADLDNENVTTLHHSARNLTREGLNSCAAHLTPADSVVLSTRAPVGSIGVTSMSSATNQGCRTPTPLYDFPPYLLAQTLGSARGELAIRANGTTFQELSTDSLASMPVPLPPLGERAAIAAAIDRETARTDALIAKKTRLIELLKEKRQAFITHTVTKGLDPSVKMKDSGVEWIDDVPEHWTLMKFRRIATVTEGLVDPRVEPYATMPLYAPNHIESGTGRLLAVETASDQEARSGKYLCTAGTVVYSKIRPNLAKVIIAPRDGLCSADMYPLTCSARALPQWLLYLILSAPFTGWAASESDRVAMPKINRESLSELIIASPPVFEQRAIAVAIDREASRIDGVVAKIERSVALLKERRSAFIAAAVTGKIDLRDAA